MFVSLELGQVDRGGEHSDEPGQAEDDDGGHGLGADLVVEVVPTQELGFAFVD